MQHYTDVDAWLADNPSWREESARLRAILQSCGLDEQVKWGKPCYAHDGDNIAIIQPFKAKVAVMFFKGALLKDPQGVLVDVGPNSRSARRVEFANTAQVEEKKSALKGLVAEAIAVERAGLSVPERTELALVDELQARLDADPSLKAAFEALTPGRQRGYNLHISSAKQSETRARRVEQCIPRILAGKGMRDR